MKVSMRTGAICLCAAAVCLLTLRALFAGEIPAPTTDVPAPTGKQMATAVFAGGCFWGVEGVYEHVKGVKKAVSGYAGGPASTAHYDLVSSGDTGHAESGGHLRPAQISAGKLRFFRMAHDPCRWTARNRTRNALPLRDLLCVSGTGAWRGHLAKCSKAFSSQLWLRSPQAFTRPRLPAFSG